MSENQKIVYEPEVHLDWVDIVWQQFRKNKLAYWGAICILVLFGLAVFAPLISMNQPLFCSIEGEWHFPLLSSMFDRNLFENSVDMFFNLQAILIPIMVAVYFLAKYFKWKRFPKGKGRLLLMYFSLVALIFVWLINYPSYLPYKDWKAEIARHTNDIHSVTAVWPISKYSYREIDGKLAHPSRPGQGHFLGTDKEGRDVFSRMLYGTRISLTIGLIAVSIYIFIGIVVGAVAGFFGGWTDIILSRIIEVMICFPTFFLILTLSALLEERSIYHVMIIIGVTGWPKVARLVRAEFLKLKGLEYVQAAVALGFSKTRVMFSHILPNAMGPVIVTAVFGIAAAILVESSLSFLGLGDSSAPSWGEILSQGRQEFKLWLILCPGMAIFAVVSLFNLVGEGLQDAMDPKMRR
jgi:peptide/nickel transport system permease protein